MLVTKFLRDCGRIAWGSAAIAELLRGTAPRVACEYLEFHFIDTRGSALELSALSSWEFGRGEASLWWSILNLATLHDSQTASAAREYVRSEQGAALQDRIRREHDFEDPRLAALVALVGISPASPPDRTVQLLARAYPSRPVSLIAQAALEGRLGKQSVLRNRRSHRNLRLAATREMAAVLALAVEVYKYRAYVTRFEDALRRWLVTWRLAGAETAPFRHGLELPPELPARFVRLLIECGALLPGQASHPTQRTLYLPFEPTELSDLVSLLPTGPARLLASVKVFWSGSVDLLSMLHLQAPVDAANTLHGKHNRCLYLVEDDVDEKSVGLAARLYRLATTPDQLATSYATVVGAGSVPRTSDTVTVHARAIAHSLDLAFASTLSDVGRRGAINALRDYATHLHFEEADSVVEVAVLTRALSTVIQSSEANDDWQAATSDAIGEVRALVEHHRHVLANMKKSRGRAVESSQDEDLVVAAWWSLILAVIGTFRQGDEIEPLLAFPGEVAPSVLRRIAEADTQRAFRALRFFGKTGQAVARSLLHSSMSALLPEVVRDYPRVVALEIVHSRPSRSQLVEYILQTTERRSDFLASLPTALADRPKVAAALELALRSDVAILPNLLQLVEDFRASEHWTYGLQMKHHYQTYQRPKQSGGKRLVTIPSDGLKFVQRTFLRTVFADLPIHPAAHGFVRGRDVTTNAKPHEGRHVVANVDISRFFDSTPYDQIRKVCWIALQPDPSPMAVALLSELCAYDMSLPTGAPTSPVIANMVLARADAAIATAANRRGVTYTRYADDLTFSADTSDAVEIIPFVARVLDELGFELDGRKTHIFRKGRRQEVTGLVVNERANVKRTYRRRLRAAIHSYVSTGHATWHGRPMTKASLMGHLGRLAQTSPAEAAELREKLKRNDR